jgi:outer membrane protein TolC
MNKIINYTLMAMILNFNVALADCEWQLVEETPTYVREQCKAGTGMGARIRNKDINGEVGEFKVVGKEASPLKKFKDKVEQAPKVAEKVEKIKEIEQEVIVTEKKVKELKEEKNVAEKVQDKVEKAVEEAQLHNTPVEETQKPIIKEEIAKKEVDTKSDEKLVKQAEDKAWADIDTEQKVGWMQLRELLPRLIVENEKIIAAEQDYEAAKEMLKSEYTAYYPQVTISVGQMHEDDRTPSKGTYPANTITGDGKHGIQKSITVTQMIWDAGRTTSMIDKAKHTTQQAYFRLELVKEDVVLEAINAWLNLQKANNTHEANKKIEANAMITLQMTIEKVKKGEGSKLEQLQIEQQYRTFQTLSMTSRLGLDSAIQRFQNVWRFEPKNIAQMPTPMVDLLGIIPVQGAPVSDNTALKIASMDVMIAEEQLNYDKAEFKPRVDGKLSYTEKDGELSGGFDTDSARKEEWRGDVTMTWKLFNIKNKHMTNADRSRLRAADLRYSDTLRRIYKH